MHYQLSAEAGGYGCGRRHRRCHIHQSFRPLAHFPTASSCPSALLAQLREGLSGLASQAQVSAMAMAQESVNQVRTLPLAARLLHVQLEPWCCAVCVCKEHSARKRGRMYRCGRAHVSVRT